MKKKRKKIEPIYRRIARRIALARIKAGITQELMGRILKLERGSISMMESGKDRIMIHNLIIIAKITNKKLSFFLEE